MEPRLEYLVKNGPYRFISHPVYLGFTIAIIGPAVANRSWLGMIAALTLFLPIEIYRAKLEEKVLTEKFGSEWDNYVSQTGFIFPFIG